MYSMNKKEGHYPSSGNGMLMILPQLKDSLLYSTRPEMIKKLAEEDPYVFNHSEEIIRARMMINPPRYV